MLNTLDLRCTFLILSAAITLEGCSETAPQRIVYQDPVTSIRLQVDDRRTNGHSHPAHVTSDTMMAILQGVRVVPRKGFVGSLLSGDDEGHPAFSAAEANHLASQLSRALELAQSNELVTFYRRISDASVGLAITSGGLFVRQQHLYFILANNRTLPSEGLNQNMVSEIDPIDSPLLPITRAGFRVIFTPSLALVPADERDTWSYVDEGRVLVLDLAHVRRILRTHPPPRVQ